jgi:D-glycero-D-manno-heptose 1,7-bisphosphate phosphatase
MKKAVFLDRDGTLNVDKGYVWRLSDWEWVPGALEALRRLKAAGFALVAVTNQSGVARGLYRAEDVDALHAEAGRQAREAGAAIDAFYFCPHLEGCDCRKPLPGMILRGAKDLGVDLGQSWTVGDRLRDIQAGLAAGTRAIFLSNGPEPSDLEKLPATAAVSPDILSAAQVVLESCR